MINRRLEEIDEAVLRALIDGGESESLTMDFKQELPARDNAGRHEFCADVCALANTQGGDIVFGMAEDAEGRASALMPVADNADDVCLRLQDIALNGLEPRITGIHAGAIAVAGGHVFVLRIPRSWHAPHRVRTNQHFFIREGRRKRQLDMPEVGAAFARASGAAEQVRNFRADRVGRILAGDPPVRLLNGVISVLHVVPLKVGGQVALDPRTYQMERHLPVMSGGQGLDFRLSLDGGIAHRPLGQEGCGAYTLVFRDGKVEATRVFTNDLGNGLLNVPSQRYEQEIIAFLDRMLAELQRLDTGPPFAVMYSLLRAGNACLGVDAAQGRWFEGNQRYRFDRETLLYPEIIVTALDNLDVTLKALFDVIWQSAGQPSSLNYNANGRWGR